MKLGLAAVHLDLGILEHLRLVVTERHDAGIHLLADKEEHVDERHLVGGKVACNLAVFRLLSGVGGVDDLRGLIIKPRKLGELTRRQLVGQHVAVECFDVGKTHRGVDFVVLAELV